MLELGVVAFGIEDAEFETALHHALGERGRKRGLADAGAARDQHRAAPGLEEDLLAVRRDAHEDALAVRRKDAVVGLLDHAHERDRAFAGAPGEAQVHAFEERGNRIAHRRAASARLEECMVVLGIPHAHDVVGGELELVQRHREARSPCSRWPAGPSPRPC